MADIIYVEDITKGIKESLDSLITSKNTKLELIKDYKAQIVSINGHYVQKIINY